MRVLISGAGIAGPTLAWFLAEAGAQVTIVEKSQNILVQGQNVDIRGSAVTVIKRMGLLPQVQALHTTEEGPQFISPDGRPVASFPVKDNSTTGLTSAFEILRGDLAAILFDATKEHQNIRYLFNTTIRQILSNGEDAVRVELSNGEVEEHDLLVAADGQWSKVRQKCFPPEYVNVKHMGMYAAYWTVPRLPHDDNWWNIYQALQSRLMMIRPDPHGAMRAMFTRMPCSDIQDKQWHEAARGDRQDKEEIIKREFADAGWQAHRLLDAMDQAPDLYFQVVQQIKMSKWSNSRVVCLGDAAHAPTLLTGMGTSLAITGAYVLAGELNKLNDGQSPVQALENYESILRPFVEKTQKLPFFIPAVAHPETAWKRWMFQTLLWILAKVVATPWVANRIGDESRDDGFPLPEYGNVDGVGTR